MLWPKTNGMAYHGAAPSSPASNSSTTPRGRLVVKRASAAISRSSAARSLRSELFTVLMARARDVVGSSERYTMPVPPRPSSPSRRYLPSAASGIQSDLEHPGLNGGDVDQPPHVRQRSLTLVR